MGVWYRAGTVAVTNGSPNVVGVGTLWLTQANVGDIFLGPDLVEYEIISITDDTHLALRQVNGTAAYAGSTNSAQTYAIIRNFTSTLPAQLASQLAALMTAYHVSLDELTAWLSGTGSVTVHDAVGNAYSVQTPAAMNVTLTGRLVKPVAGGGDITITSAEAANLFHELTGTRTAAGNYIVPASVRHFFVFNATAYAMTVKTPSGTGVAVSAGERMLVECDGTNVVNAFTAAMSPSEAQAIATAVANAAASAASAQTAKTSAESARDAALIQSGVYVDEPTGRAAVADGVAFKVQGAGDVAAYEYRRVNAGAVSTLLTIYPSKAALDNRFEGDYTTATEFLWGVLDANKELVLSILMDGTLQAKLVGHTPQMIDTVDGEIYSIVDSVGRKLLAIAKDGMVSGKFSAPAEVVSARGTRADLDARLSQSFTQYGLPKAHQYGEWFMRETRQRLRKLLLGEAQQLVVATIGDSWTHSRTRWTGPASQTLQTLYGNAGPGWCGFGWGFGGASDVWSGGNGAVGTDMAVALTANWLTHYNTSAGVDISDIYTSTAGARVTATYSGSGNVSAVNLHYIAGAVGTIRYSFDAGVTWTTIDTSIGAGLAIAALAGIPAGAWALWVENVSGTTTVCGVDVVKTASGVRWHKLGGTGSTAGSWAGANGAQWSAGLASLAPNLVIIMLATNDQPNGVAAFTSSMQTLITRIKTTLPLADILLVCPCENGRANVIQMSDYAAATYQLAATNQCGFIDLQYLFGATYSEYASTSPRAWFNADTIHPEPNTGGRVIVDAIIKFLTN